jgi:hypothetical protein
MLTDTETQHTLTLRYGIHLVSHLWKFMFFLFILRTSMDVVVHDMQPLN